jgi:hypothetical protein
MAAEKRGSSIAARFRQIFQCEPHVRGLDNRFDD